MNLSETKELLTSVCRVCGGFVGWRQEELRRLAAANGTTIEHEAAKFTSGWYDVMADVSLDAAGRVLTLIARGDLLLPPYGSLASFIRREAKHLSQPQQHPKPQCEYKSLEHQYGLELDAMNEAELAELDLQMVRGDEGQLDELRPWKNILRRSRLEAMATLFARAGG